MITCYYTPGEAPPEGRECRLVSGFPNDRVRCLTCHKSFHRTEALPCVTEGVNAKAYAEAEYRRIRGDAGLD